MRTTHGGDSLTLTQQSSAEGEIKCKTGNGITDSTLKKTMCLESTMKYELYEQTKCCRKLTTHFGTTKTSVTRQEGPILSSF